MPTSQNRKITAILLAAGRSTRMGRTKQLLPLGRTTLLEQTLEHLQKTNADEILLVLGAAAGTIESHLPATLLANVRIVLNPAYEKGMATSIQSGLAAVPPGHHAAMIVLADQPFIRPETFNQLMNEYRRTQPKILLPTHQGKRGNPLILDRTMFPAAQTLEGDSGFRSLLGQHLQDILKVEVEDPAILDDIDTKADYDRIQKPPTPNP